MPRNDAFNAVLARYGVTAQSVRAIPRGRVNQHWRVESEGGSYVLRRYAWTPLVAARHTPDSIAVEHRALLHAEASGWPVAPPVRSDAGTTTVDDDVALYALFPLLPGRPAARESLRQLGLKGRLLARLHRDMAAFDAGGQRPGFARMWELDRFMGSTRTVTQLLHAFNDHYSDYAWAVRTQRYRNLHELSRLGYGELPQQYCHFDFHRDNLLFDHRALSGLLDFDSSHVDSRVADIATSIALDCIEPPTYNAISPDAVRAFVAGYAQGAPLSESESQLVVPLVRSWIVTAAVGRIAQWLAAPDDRVVAKIDRTVNARIPAFEQRRAELDRAVRDAVETARS
jgi:Ser/Thr protein kinase RdoA (MazF antagonist)